MPAREAKEAADVTRRYESWELMLELGLADARPMTCKVTVYKHYIHTVLQCSQCGPRLRGNINSVPLHPIWCGPYFKRPLPVAGLSKVRPTLLWSDLLGGRTELLTTCIQWAGGSRWNNRLPEAGILQETATSKPIQREH